jgi:hypothetical protein
VIDTQLDPSSGIHEMRGLAVDVDVFGLCFFRG